MPMCKQLFTPICKLTSRKAPSPRLILKERLSALKASFSPNILSIGASGKAAQCDGEDIARRLVVSLRALPEIVRDNIIVKRNIDINTGAILVCSLQLLRAGVV